MKWLITDEDCSEITPDLTLGILLFTDDDSSASLDHVEGPGFGLSALEPKHDLLCVLGLLSEDGLSLPSESLLLHIISSLSLSGGRVLTLLVLGNLVDGVLLGLPAVGPLGLWNMHHFVFLINN